MKGRRSWRTGFDINLTVAGWLPVVSLTPGVIGIVSPGGEETDMRLSPIRWLMTISGRCLVALPTGGFISAHVPI
jgi:hypothetical protein